jgi:hypothetical protein
MQAAHKSRGNQPQTLAPNTLPRAANVRLRREGESSSNQITGSSATNSNRESIIRILPNMLQTKDRTLF